MSTELIILIAQALLRYGPVVAKALADLFSKQNPTLADWDKVFAVAQKPYDDYVKAREVPPVTLP